MSAQTNFTLELDLPKKRMTLLQPPSGNAFKALQVPHPLSLVVPSQEELKVNFQVPQGNGPLHFQGPNGRDYRVAQGGQEAPLFVPSSGPSLFRVDFIADGSRTEQMVLFIGRSARERMPDPSNESFILEIDGNKSLVNMPIAIGDQQLMVVSKEGFDITLPAGCRLHFKSTPGSPVIIVKASPGGFEEGDDFEITGTEVSRTVKDVKGSIHLKMYRTGEGQEAVTSGSITVQRGSTGGRK